MPMLTIVTFTDEDGDEFPVAIVGIPDTDEEAERLARERSVELAGEEPRWRPTGELTVKTIEYPAV